MNTKNFIAAAAVFVVAGSAFAADAPDAAATASASASRLNLPVLGAPSDTSHEEAKAEAVDFLKNYRTTLSVQLEQYKN